jgi:branched-chain amino acid transport system substrate-binding protein
MGISKREIERLRDWTILPISQSLNLSISLLLFCSFLTSCTSIRPVIKIGLLAPFEGVERRSGYVALTAMRQAIADSTPTNVTIMPLALDSGADSTGVERAARKLLQDAAVAALVGPYTPLLIQQMETVVTRTHLPWLVPFAINPTGGFVAPHEDGAWAVPLVRAAAAAAAQLGSQRLVLVGWMAGWPQLITAQSDFALPLLMEPNPTIQPTDAIFWLGDAKEGAVYFTALRARFPEAPFLLAPYAADPIFSEQTQISGPVYLLYWQDDGYEPWRTRYPDLPPSAYLTYRATQVAITQILGETTLEAASWRIQTVALASDQVE